LSSIRVTVGCSNVARETNNERGNVTCGSKPPAARARRSVTGAAMADTMEPSISKTAPVSPVGHAASKVEVSAVSR
jgi:hypothetical protein